MEKTHKHALKVLNLDYSSNYSQLLEKSSCVILHVKHLQHLMTEIYKTFKHLNPVFMKEIFITKEGCYNFRNINLLKVHTPRTEKFGVREISFRGSQIWNQLPKSNLPSVIFYSSVSAEILRIARATSNQVNFIKSAKALLDRMTKQGANRNKLENILGKVYGRHRSCFQSLFATSTHLVDCLL